MPLEWPVRPLGAKRPAGRAAPRDGAIIAAVLAGEILELQRDVGPAPGLDQVAPRDRDRRAGPLLVAGQHDPDVGVAQRSGRLHRAQRGDDHDQPALVVADAGAGRAIAFAGEALERAGGLEHRVEMADQQQPLAAPVAAMTRRRCAPPGRSRAMSTQRTVEAERLELRPHHRADRGHALAGSACRYSGSPAARAGRHAARPPRSPTSLIRRSAGLN